MRNAWWMRGEYFETREDFQEEPDLTDPSGADLVAVDRKLANLIVTPLGEPDLEFDVRSVYDSRPVNAYDFNFSFQSGLGNVGTGFAWSATFNVPNGYRAVPRAWDVQFECVNQALAVGALGLSIANIQQNGAAVPNNQNIIIGLGTVDPIETFFICEENTTFGIAGFTPFPSPAIGGFANINVYGNLIAVSEVALPFSIANKRYGT